VLVNPRVEANRLHSLPDCYKIKLRSSGYRLVYQVIDHEVVCLSSRWIDVTVSRLTARTLSDSNRRLQTVCPNTEDLCGKRQRGFYPFSKGSY